MSKFPAWAFLALWSLLVGAGLRVAADDAWPRFRGPNGAGVSDAKTVPVEWQKDEANWIAELPGGGAGSVVAREGKIYVTSADEQRGVRRLSCLAADSGKELWGRQIEFKTYKKHRNNSFASSTPAVDEHHVYVLWQSKTESPLIAFDHDGKEKWRYDLGSYKHGQGAGTSPIVAGEMVVVCNDHSAGSFLLAVDRLTGKQVWKQPREGKRACYATPCVRQLGGGRWELVFSHCFEGITGVDPATGETNWHADVFGRFAQRAVGSPVLWRDLVIANSGAALGDKNLVAVRATEGGAEEAYRVDRAAPHVPTPLVYDDRLYLWNDAGIASCVQVEDGKILWQSRAGGSKYFGSPVCVDGKIYNVDFEGVVRVIATGPAFKLLGETDLGETSRSTPAVSQGVMYIRTDRHVHSIGGAAP